MWEIQLKYDEKLMLWTLSNKVKKQTNMTTIYTNKSTIKNAKRKTTNGRTDDLTCLEVEI